MNHEFTNYAFADYLPVPFAADPGGMIPNRDSMEYHSSPEMLDTPIQRSPPAYWNPGLPYPGPPASQQLFVDYDSRKWWGRMGQGALVWSGQGEITADLPPMVPMDTLQHLDTFQRFWGGFPSMARNRPPAFGSQVPIFNPSLSNWNT